MTLINEQLHLVQLELYEEKQKSLAQAEKIEELELNLTKERQKAKRFWRDRCDQQLAHEDALEKKDVEINRLLRQLQSLQTAREEQKFDKPLRHSFDHKGEERDATATRQRGKALPVHLFTGERSDELWDEWLPIFKGAAE